MDAKILEIILGVSFETIISLGIVSALYLWSYYKLNISVINWLRDEWLLKFSNWMVMFSITGLFVMTITHIEEVSIQLFQLSPALLAVVPKPSLLTSIVAFIVGVCFIIKGLIISANESNRKKMIDNLSDDEKDFMINLIKSPENKIMHEPNETIYNLQDVNFIREDARDYGDGLLLKGKSAGKRLTNARVYKLTKWAEAEFTLLDFDKNNKEVASDMSTP